MDTTPGAQEGKYWGRWPKGKSGVGRIEGEESKTADPESFFSGSGMTEGGEE